MEEYCKAVFCQRFTEFWHLYVPILRHIIAEYGMSLHVLYLVLFP
jgi:hypothetical protein